MATEDNAILQQAQSRLLERRASLKATTSLGPVMQRTDDEPISTFVERCMHKAQKRHKIGVVSFPGHSSLEAEKPERNYLGYFGVPPRHRYSTLDNYEGNQRLVDDLKGMATCQNSLLLTGKTGCGKTHLAVGIMAEYLRLNLHKAHSDTALFIGAPELLMRIRASFDKGATTSETEIVNRYSQCGLLVLDDLGAEKTSEFSITTLYIILDRRNAHCRKTIVTSNLSLKEISATIGDRIASRLADMRVINIATMPDWRKQRKENKC